MNDSPHPRASRPRVTPAQKRHARTVVACGLSGLFLSAIGIGLLINTQIAANGNRFHASTLFDKLVIQPAVYQYATGTVTSIVTRAGIETAGLQKRVFARVEYHLPEKDMNCFFHQELHEKENVAYTRRGLNVDVRYDSAAHDACGTSEALFR